VRHFIELEGLLLSSSSDPFLESHVVRIIISNSLHWKSRSEVEWSIDIESKSTVISLGSYLGCFVNIDNSPSLVSSTVSLPDMNFLSFGISVCRNIENLVVVNISEESSFIGEDLPPF
jgi:hypothetical protein